MLCLIVNKLPVLHAASSRLQTTAAHRCCGQESLCLLSFLCFLQSNRDAFRHDLGLLELFLLGPNERKVGPGLPFFLRILEFIFLQRLFYFLFTFMFNLLQFGASFQFRQSNSCCFLQHTKTYVTVRNPLQWHDSKLSSSPTIFNAQRRNQVTYIYFDVASK